MRHGIVFALYGAALLVLFAFDAHASYAQAYVIGTPAFNRLSTLFATASNGTAFPAATVVFLTALLVVACVHAVSLWTILRGIPLPAQRKWDPKGFRTMRWLLPLFGIVMLATVFFIPANEVWHGSLPRSRLLFGLYSAATVYAAILFFALGEWAARLAAAPP